MPFVHLMREQGNTFTTLPDFKLAQQAIAYLALTVEDEQLMVCISAAPEEARRLVKGTISLLDRLSRNIDEAAVVAEIEPVLRAIFVSTAFRQVATPEQRIAVNFIVGRAAFHRMHV